MKKRIAMLLIAGALSVSMMTGCSQSKSEDTKKTETSVSVKKEKTSTTAKEEKTIGEKSEGAFEVKLTNSTGQDITAVAIKTSNEEAYPASILKIDDSFAKDETRTLYYKPSEEAAKSTATETGKELPVEYTVQLTFADKTSLELHAFPFDSVKEAKILLQDQLAYITYEQDGKEVSTLEAEKAIKTQTEEAKKASDAAAATAAAEAEAAAQAEAAAAAEAAASSASSSSTSTESDTSYTEPAATYTEPAQSTESSASTETDNSAASEGCITDGLTY